MCLMPKIPEVTKFQESKSPAYRHGRNVSQPNATTGRRGTNLVGGGGLGGALLGIKKRLLGD